MPVGRLIGPNFAAPIDPFSLAPKGSTAIGAPAPNLYTAKEISGNPFEIAGRKAGGKVS